MKKHPLYLFLLMSSCQINDKTKASMDGCEKFKQGKFVQTWYEDPNKYKIERNDSTQKEFIGKDSGYLNLKIKWTGSCSYELTFLNQHIIGPDSVSNPSEIRKLKVEILQIKNDSCFVIGDNGIDRVRGIIYADKR